MQIENEFEVAAPPERVYAFLLDINRVVTCMPGAQLAEVVDPDTFKGKVRIKVGPITVAYNGTARITERDEANRSATLAAEGRETTGPGSARATARMSVEPAGDASRVKLVTDYTVAGRVANFGRGVMEDVSRRLVGQMADCIKANLEAPEEAPAAAEAGPTSPAAPPSASAPAAAEGAAAKERGAAGQVAETAPRGAEAAEVRPTTPAAPAPSAAAPPPAARPVNALSLFFGVLWDRIKRLFGSR